VTDAELRAAAMLVVRQPRDPGEGSLDLRSTMAGYQHGFVDALLWVARRLNRIADAGAHEARVALRQAAGEMVRAANDESARIRLRRV